MRSIISSLAESILAGVLGSDKLSEPCIFLWNNRIPYCFYIFKSSENLHVAIKILESVFLYEICHFFYRGYHIIFLKKYP
jgi:hypothetical protein